MESGKDERRPRAGAGERRVTHWGVTVTYFETVVYRLDVFAKDHALVWISLSLVRVSLVGWTGWRALAGSYLWYSNGESFPSPPCLPGADFREIR